MNERGLKHYSRCDVVRGEVMYLSIRRTLGAGRCKDSVLEECRRGQMPRAGWRASFFVGVPPPLCFVFFLLAKQGARSTIQKNNEKKKQPTRVALNFTSLG